MIPAATDVWLLGKIQMRQHEDGKNKRSSKVLLVAEERPAWCIGKNLAMATAAAANSGRGDCCARVGRRYMVLLYTCVYIYIHICSMTRLTKPNWNRPRFGLAYRR